MPPANDSQIYDSGFLENASTTAPPVTLGPTMNTISCEQHAISSLVLPDLVVLATYLYGVYLFVQGGSDYLFSLASHVSLWLGGCPFLRTVIQ